MYFFKNCAKKRLFVIYDTKNLASNYFEEDPVLTI